MDFALFYEIPVAKPWNETSELDAYRNTIEQAVSRTAVFRKLDLAASRTRADFKVRNQAAGTLVAFSIEDDDDETAEPVSGAQSDNNDFLEG